MENMFILVFIWIKCLVGDGLIWWFPIYTDLVTNRLIGCHKLVLVVWSFSSCFRNWKIIKISLFKRESPSWWQTPRQCWAVCWCSYRWWRGLIGHWWLPGAGAGRTSAWTAPCGGIWRGAHWVHGDRPQCWRGSRKEWRRPYPPGDRL